MIKRLFRNNIRRPLYSLAVLLFATVMTLVLCFLHKSAQDEQKSFEETFVSVPVAFRVTDLDGSKPGTVEGWITDLFTEQGMAPNLAPYVAQLYTRVSRSGTYITYTTDARDFIVKVNNPVTVAGIGSLYVAEELTENWGGQTHWYEGFDESILLTEELVCLLPESMKDMTEIELHFTHTYTVGDFETVTVNTSRTFRVAGYYVDKGNSRIYCPYPAMKQIFAELSASKDLEEVCAILNDNNSLPQLRETAAQWFAQPNPTGEKTPWGRFGYESYFYALDIDDYMLRNLETNMKNSMQLNYLASVVVFVLSAGAGFLTGFLVIRARKREISLMRTMGASHPAIFMELALEQLMCVAAGILLGGMLFAWQPVQKLLLFGGIYVVGLSIALVIFLSKNLLTTMKEDE